MKCEDHPFYPRRYCMGCTYKTRQCDICGADDAELHRCESSANPDEGKEIIHICNDCYRKLVSERN